MSDELDVLRRDHDRVEPDPEFRAQLIDRLRRDMAARPELVLHPLAPSTDGSPRSEEGMPSVDPSKLVTRRPPRPNRRIVAVAAAIVLIAALGVAVTRDRGPAPDVDTVPLIIDDITPGSTVELPAAPLSPRSNPVVIWSGTEMIVWGGEGDAGPRSDGAAFDPAAGAWRVIAPAPIEARGLPLVAWTGSEMVVVGGSVDRDDVPGGEQFLDGAAYDPSTDTWRSVPKAPMGLLHAAQPVWTGEELVVVGPGVTTGARAAAYDPETNSWRRLADPPVDAAGRVVWTGEVLLVTGHLVHRFEGVELDEPTSLVRYDPSADRWDTVSNERYAYLLGVPDDEGAVREVLAVPMATGEPVTVLGLDGRVDHTLPALPGAQETFGEWFEPGLDRAYSYRGTWQGEEALLWMRSFDSPLSSVQRPAPWALNPEAGTWRSLGTSAPPFSAHLVPMDDEGVFLGWGPLSGEGAIPGAIAYRPPGLDDDIVVEVDPLGLPEPGEQPADPARMEEQVRNTYASVYDPSLSPEARAEFTEHPDVWLKAWNELKAGQFGEWIVGMHPEVDEVVFTSPSRASLRFRLLAPDPRVPETYEDFVIGEAVLVDGRWLMATSTSCELFRGGMVSCDMTP